MGKNESPAKSGRAGRFVLRGKMTGKGNGEEGEGL